MPHHAPALTVRLRTDQGTQYFDFSDRQDAQEQVDELNELVTGGLLPSTVRADILTVTRYADRLVDLIPGAAALADRLETLGYTRRAGEWADQPGTPDDELLTLGEAVAHARARGLWTPTGPEQDYEVVLTARQERYAATRVRAASPAAAEQAARDEDDDGSLTWQDGDWSDTEATVTPLGTPHPKEP